MYIHSRTRLLYKNGLQGKIVSFIKNADLYLENFEYVEMRNIKVDVSRSEERPEEKVLDVPDQIMDQIRLVSTYKGVQVPSMLFDSTGTKKIAALASYIIEGIEQGRILVVDELDSSIHFKLTRAIVAMFNNELNRDATDIIEKYRKGALGALPDPELIHSLLDMKGNKEGGSADAE